MAATATIDAYIASLQSPFQEIGERLRRLIDAGLPGSKSSIWHGHPVWKIGKEPVALIKAYPSYVSFGLWKGQSIADASGRLEAGARDMAYAKLRSVFEIDPALIAEWLRQAQELESVGK
jgi:hypothetical protein